MVVYHGRTGDAAGLARLVQGLRSVVFTGGEPTLRPDLPQCVAHARGLGFEGNPGSVERAPASIQGLHAGADQRGAVGRASVAPRRLGRSSRRHRRHWGSFALANHALRVLGSTPSLRVEANCVVSRQNMHEVAQLPSLVAAQAPEARSGSRSQSWKARPTREVTRSFPGSPTSSTRCGRRSRPPETSVYGHRSRTCRRASPC